MVKVEFNLELNNTSHWEQFLTLFPVLYKVKKVVCCLPPRVVLSVTTFYIYMVIFTTNIKSFQNIHVNCLYMVFILEYCK